MQLQWAISWSAADGPPSKLCMDQVLVLCTRHNTCWYLLLTPGSCSAPATLHSCSYGVGGKRDRVRGRHCVMAMGHHCLFLLLVGQFAALQADAHSMEAVRN